MKSARSTCMRGNEANTPREPLIHNMGVLDDGTLSSRRWGERPVSTSDLSRLLRTTQRRVGELAVAALIVAAPPVFTSLN